MDWYHDLEKIKVAIKIEYVLPDIIRITLHQANFLPSYSLLCTYVCMYGMYEGSHSEVCSLVIGYERRMC